MPNLTHGLNGLGKDNCKTRRDTFWDLVWIMLEVWRYWNALAWNNFIILCMLFTSICKYMITLPIHVMCIRTCRPNNIPNRNLVVYGCLQRNMCIPKTLVYEDNAVWFYDAKRNRQFISCTYVYVCIHTHTYIYIYLVIYNWHREVISNRKETSCLPLLNAGFESWKFETPNCQQTEYLFTNRLSYPLRHHM